MTLNVPLYECWPSGDEEEDPNKAEMIAEEKGFLVELKAPWEEAGDAWINALTNNIYNITITGQNSWTTKQILVVH